MAIQMIGTAAPYVASSVGSVVVSAALAILAVRIIEWISTYFNIKENLEHGSKLDTILMYGTIAAIFCPGPASSYALTTFLTRNYSYATIAKITNVILGFVGSIGGVILNEYLPDIPVKKA